MAKDYENMTVFEQIKAGLQQSIAHTRGQLTLRTTRLPAPPPPIKAGAVIRIRQRLQMSQGVFAAALNVSAKTIQSWEQGVRQPSQGALRLLELFDRQPDVVEMLFSSEPRATVRATVKTALASARHKKPVAASGAARKRIASKSRPSSLRRKKPARR